MEEIVIEKEVKKIVFFHYQAHIVIDIFKSLIKKIENKESLKIQVCYSSNLFKVNLFSTNNDLNENILDDLKAPSIESIEDDFEKMEYNSK